MLVTECMLPVGDWIYVGVFSVLTPNDTYPDVLSPGDVFCIWFSIWHVILLRSNFSESGSRMLGICFPSKLTTFYCQCPFAWIFFHNSSFILSSWKFNMKTPKLEVCRSGISTFFLIDILTWKDTIDSASCYGTLYQGLTLSCYLFAS
jgi:hypothetical protein